MNSLPPTKHNEPLSVTLQQIGIGSFIKWQTLAFFILGMFAGTIYTSWFALAGQITGRTVAWYFLVTSLSYAVIGFLSSTILGVLYNSLAARIGGMRFEIVTHNNPVPPPPPERWEGTLPKINDPDTRGRA